jgi:hypothetical protein
MGSSSAHLGTLGKHRKIADDTQEHMIQAETLRLCGDLLRCTGEPAAAERNYGDALTLARRQSAKLWELRAATSLARLWRDQGKRLSVEAGQCRRSKGP